MSDIKEALRIAVALDLDGPFSQIQDSILNLMDDPKSLIQKEAYFNDILSTLYRVRNDLDSIEKLVVLYRNPAVYVNPDNDNMR